MALDTCEKIQAAMFRANPGGFVFRTIRDAYIKAGCLEAARATGGGSMASRTSTFSPMIVTRRTGLTQTRQESKLQAQTLKLAGAGAVGTGTRPSSFGSATFGGQIGGAIGEQIGGTTGEGIGTALGTFLEDLLRKKAGGGTGTPSSGGQTNLTGTVAPCPEGTRRVGTKCVDLLALPPGGKPGVIPAPGTAVGAPGGTAVMGAFGLPAMSPRIETRVHRSCGPGMVLGKDNLCYPKRVLPRRSNMRKWKGDRRPPVTAADARAIRRAERARGRVKDLAKDVGFSVKKR